MAVERVFVCDANVEVTSNEGRLEVVLAGVSDKAAWMIPEDTVFEVPCGFEVDATIDSVIGITGRAQWDCPRCGTTNTRELSADDLG